MSLADRFFRGRDPYALQGASVGQNKDRHKTALDASSLLVNTQKLGARSQPSFLR